MNQYSALLTHIDYQFKDVALLNLAFTHRSASKTHNERLEFLGDAVLGLVIAERMFEKFPDLPEGKLTRMRSNLVKGDTLTEIARELNLGELLLLGSGEKKSGGRRRDSILADVVESIIGAIYIDSGFAECQRVINKLFASRIDKLDPNIQIKDNKTLLQEFTQARKYALPEYTVTKVSGKDHDQTFTVSCTVSGLDISRSAEGKSRRIAEQEAAKLILASINK